MRTPFFRGVVLFVLALAGPLVSARAEESEFQAGLNQRLESLTRGAAHGVAVLVARDGKIAYEGAFGVANAEKGAPVSVDTVFRIGSVSKQFTAAAVLRLAEEGKLSLKDPVQKYFPNFPRGGEITLHHLLTHTSGICNYTERSDFMARVERPLAPADVIEAFRNEPPDFAPGAGFKYCNSGYFLAGEIVAQVSGKSLAEYLQTTFFVPLGMKNTGVYFNATPPAGAAAGYAFADGQTTPAVDWDMSWAGGAGALYSTVGDLFLWNEALHGGKVLGAGSLKAQSTPVTLPADVDRMDYGYGLVVSQWSGLPLLAHSGGLHGWSSDLLWFPNQHCTVVVLANAMPTQPGLEPGALSRAIASEFLKAEIQQVAPPQEATDVDPETYTAYVGRYDYKNAVMTVTVHEGRLHAQLTDQPRHEIFPRAPDEFF